MPKKYFMAQGFRGIVHHEFQLVSLFRCSIPTLEIRDRANHILSLLGEERNIIRLTSVDKFQMHGMYPPAPWVVRVPVAGAASPRDGQGPDLDNEEEPFGKDKAVVVSSDSSSSNDDGLSSRMRGLARGPLDEPTSQVRAKVTMTSRCANPGRPSLLLPPPRPAPARQAVVQPADQGTRSPTRAAGSASGRKAAESATRRIERDIPFLDEVLPDLGDGVPNWLYSAGFWDLSLVIYAFSFVHLFGTALMKLSSACDDSRGSSDTFQERMKVLEVSVAIKDKVNAELEVLLIEKQRMVSGLETMLSAKNTENTNQVALISRLQTDLEEHKKKLQEALDG
uniref:Uncharacterized protein n=1 Tax=Cannabis sativa TaxID=3483 RepID=A0A803PZN3_CANSA